MVARAPSPAPAGILAPVLGRRHKRRQRSIQRLTRIAIARPIGLSRRDYRTSNAPRALRYPQRSAACSAIPRGGYPGIRDLASLSKTLARNRKSCTGVAATKGRHLGLAPGRPTHHRLPRFGGKPLGRASGSASFFGNAGVAMTNAQEGVAVLEAAQRHLHAVTECIDYLSQVNASAALRTLAVRLQELSFREGSRASGCLPSYWPRCANRRPAAG
jgi:hypothetical protein